MTQAENLDLSRGQKEYDSKVKNLEGIFGKIEKILDISQYIEELQSIKNKVDNNPEFSNRMMTKNMQLDYEGAIYSKYIKEIDILTKKVEEEMLPFYELYLLYYKIDIQLQDINSDNIGDIIINTKNLIDILNRLNTHNNPSKNSLINKAYQTIYSVIIYEELFERQDILNYINRLNIASNKENIGRLLEQDLDKLLTEDVIDEDLKTIKTEGLGYDYLTTDIIQKISNLIAGEKKTEYQEKRKKAILELSQKISEFNNIKNQYNSDLDNNKKEINRLHLKKNLIIAKLLSLILIPIITFSAGKALGKKASDKITEYQTITRTINLETNEIIGDIEYTYDSEETTYVGTLMLYTPWQEKTQGSGYTRTIYAYEYVISDNTKGNYDITNIDNIINNLKLKYSYNEYKDNLSKDDETNNVTILITETYQDKSVNRHSTKYIIPGAIIGLGIGFTINLILLGLYRPNEMNKLFYDLKREIKEYKLSNEEIKKKLLEMKEEALRLQKEYSTITKKYGTIEEQTIIESKKKTLT